MKTMLTYCLSLVTLYSPLAIANFHHHDRVLSRLHHINALEIDAGNLARTKGQSAQVRQLGEMLARHHSAADQQVVRTARLDRVQLFRWAPRTQKEMQDAREERRLMHQLRNLRGHQFDRVFLRGMVQGHDVAIQWLQEVRPSLRGYHAFNLVRELLPQLRQHRAFAVRLLRH